jgi:hypothetical protein
MRKLALAAALALFATPATAGSFACVQAGSYTQCNWGDNVGGSIAHIIRVPQPQTDAERAEVQARTEKWEAFCKPTPTIDRYGVTRYAYAHENCDLGRSQ